MKIQKIICLMFMSVFLFNFSSAHARGATTIKNNGKYLIKDAVPVRTAEDVIRNEATIKGTCDAMASVVVYYIVKNIPRDQWDQNPSSNQAYNLCLDLTYRKGNKFMIPTVGFLLQELGIK